VNPLLADRQVQIGEIAQETLPASPRLCACGAFGGLAAWRVTGDSWTRLKTFASWLTYLTSGSATKMTDRTATRAA